MNIPVQFDELMRGLAADHFVQAYCQYHDLRAHYADLSHPDVQKAKSVLEEARAFRLTVQPDWVEQQPASAA